MKSKSLIFKLSYISGIALLIWLGVLTFLINRDELITVFIGTFLFILLPIYISIQKMVVAPLKKIEKVMKDTVNGDLTKRIDIKSKDELEILSDDFNRIVSMLHDYALDIKSHADVIAASADSVGGFSHDLAANVGHQMEDTESVATAMKEMAASVEEVAHNTQQANDASHVVSEAAHEGEKNVQETVKMMHLIADFFQTATKTINTLGDRSKQIGEIISMIDDIADQTNLLALNAAIEAARAGEQGRGFAVVADEVRKLAEKTSKATKEIADMIKGIQVDTKNAVSAMDEGTKEGKAGVSLAIEAGAALDKIVETVKRVSDMIAQIATAAEEQSATTEEITRNIGSIAEVSKDTMTKAEASSSVTEEMKKLAEELESLVNRFKLRQN